MADNLLSTVVLASDKNAPCESETLFNHFSGLLYRKFMIAGNYMVFGSLYHNRAKHAL